MRSAICAGSEAISITGGLYLGWDMLQQTAVQLFCGDFRTPVVADKLKVEAFPIDRNTQACGPWRQIEQCPKLLLRQFVEASLKSKKHAPTIVRHQRRRSRVRHDCSPEARSLYPPPFVLDDPNLFLCELRFESF